MAEEKLYTENELIDEKVDSYNNGYENGYEDGHEDGDKIEYQRGWNMGFDAGKAVD